MIQIPFRLWTPILQNLSGNVFTHFFLFLQLDSSKECLKAVQKMNSCPACQGYPNLKPCSNYCINVMKGCLVFHIELQNHWDKFIDAMNNLGERLKGPFNLDNIVLSLDIKISDAIMTFQVSYL